MNSLIAPLDKERSAKVPSVCFSFTRVDPTYNLTLLPALFPNFSKPRKHEYHRDMLFMSPVGIVGVFGGWF